jgi:hypothetical protein
MINQMTAINYPVAGNAEQALSRPLGRAVREREALNVAGEAVVFTTDPMGPAFATYEAALDAYRGRVEDERSGAAPEPQDRFCRLAEQVIAQPGLRLSPVEPTFEDGHRWPKPAGEAPRTAWRLMVPYWRVATAARPIAAPPAPRARRGKQPLDPETLRTIAREPLRPVEPQQPLDIGLFEVRPPEAPHIVMPDE